MQNADYVHFAVVLLGVLVLVTGFQIAAGTISAVWPPTLSGARLRVIPLETAAALRMVPRDNELALAMVTASSMLMRVLDRMVLTNGCRVNSHVTRCMRCGLWFGYCIF